MALNSSNLMWYIKEDSVLTPYDEYYAGSYMPGSTLEFTLQIWNNRLGTEEVQTAYNPKVVLFFDSIENSVLLNYCTVSIDGVQITMTRDLDKGIAPIGRDLSGKIGLVDSGDNFAEVQIKIGPLPNGLRNELKNMFIDIESDMEGGV